MASENVIDRLISHLSSDTKSEQSNAILVEKLSNIIKDELILAKKLEAEARHMIYAHLADDVRKLVAEKNKLAEQTHNLLKSLGYSGDTGDAEEYEAMPSGQFTGILDIETTLGDRLVEDLNWSEENHYPEAASFLIKLKEIHSRHQEEIERILMKINATL